ncbi:MAG: pilus assembly protein [Pseudomonadales bacterium]|nr:pilus assembly protein [Pseudomonadales bacterium]
MTRRRKLRGKFALRGAATVEFYVVALFVMIPMAMAILQLGLLYTAKNTLNYATFLAARAGSVHNGSKTQMNNYLAKGLVPLYARTDTELTNANVAGVVGRAYISARADVMNPIRTRLRVLNPTRASFADFEESQFGVRQIPNDNLQYRRRNGASSQQTIQQANLLKIRVDYCYRLIFPIIDRMITSTLRLTDANAFHQLCYAANRVPISAQAIVHMQSAPQRRAMGL